MEDKKTGRYGLTPKRTASIALLPLGGHRFGELIGGVGTKRATAL